MGRAIGISDLTPEDIAIMQSTCRELMSSIKSISIQVATPDGLLRMTAHLRSCLPSITSVTLIANSIVERFPKSLGSLISDWLQAWLQS